MSGTSTTYLYDRLNLVQEKTGSTTTDYLFGPGVDEPLAESISGTVYNFGVDGLGSVTLTTAASGTAQNTYVYDAWGKTRHQTGSNPNPPFGYTARENGELGTIYYRARYYQPGIGRFLQEDPIGYKLHAPVEKYSYVANDPVRWFDPLGLLRVPGYSEDPNANSVVCDGHGHIVPQLGSPGSAKQQQCFGDCLMLHERTHVDDMNRRVPGLCMGRKPGAAIEYGDKDEAQSYEVPGNTAELHCLRSKRNADPGDAKCCNESIKQREQDVKRELLNYQ